MSRSSLLRVAGADPGTSSLDLLLLEDGTVADQCRLSPDDLRTDPVLPVRWLQERGPLALVAGPSGYGLPLIPAAQGTEEHLDLMTLVRPDERGQAHGVAGFSAVVRALCASALPVVFLPGVLHLPTVPVHRKINRIDLGTPDKLCVAALALALRPSPAEGEDSFCVVELGTTFTACLVVRGGCVVDGVGGTCGPVGWGSGGAWDGEAAYLLSPLAKSDLFSGGASGLDDDLRRALLSESLLKTVAGLQAVTPFGDIVLSGRLLEGEPELATLVTAELQRLGRIVRLGGLPGAWVKQAAQGAALLADGLAGGRHEPLVTSLRLREASGSVLDWLRYLGADAVRATFRGRGSCAPP
ncbi:MAG: DUF1464 family protein [Planctomycetes bacterium]|nr:DUF1464 family protein [Planctomycetota bacterium]